MPKCQSAIALLATLLLASPALAEQMRESAKELFLPAKIWKVPEGNDFSNPDSEFSHARKVESDHVAIFWSKKLGDDLAKHPEPANRVDLALALKECERFYDHYVNTIRFVEKGKSLADRYKVVFLIFGEEDGTAYGGGTDDKIGMLWSGPQRINKVPYGAIAHELGHSFQYLLRADGGWGFSSAPEGTGHSIHEMTSQWMLWQVYPEWMTFENYHLVDYMKKTHYALFHETNMYHTPYMLEYWSSKHGGEFIGKLWRDGKAGEDPVATYQRLTQIDQKQFNDEVFDAAQHFMTWDLPRVEKVASRYANGHTSELVDVGEGWYRIAEGRCPQNYGHNGIRLKVPATEAIVTLQFKGIAGANGYRSVQTDKAGWRYGFVAVKGDGSRVYGETHREPEGTATFVVPSGTQHLWLVVTGAPTEHWPHVADGKDENDEQWPYQIHLEGTSPDDSVLKRP